MFCSRENIKDLTDWIVSKNLKNFLTRIIGRTIVLSDTNGICICVVLSVGVGWLADLVVLVCGLGRRVKASPLSFDGESNLSRLDVLRKIRPCVWFVETESFQLD